MDARTPGAKAPDLQRLLAELTTLRRLVAEGEGLASMTLAQRLDWRRRAIRYLAKERRQ